MGNTLCAISTSDTRANRQVDALLQSVGIKRDGNLDYTCGIFDDDWRLIATGSCFHNTIRCLAVAADRQGEGLLNEIVSHLVEVQSMRGNTRLFLYTKPQSAKFFTDIGYAEITRTADLVFMENRRNGFSSWLESLADHASSGRTAAIVMNANPFTLGHRHLVETAARENDTVHLFLLSEEAGPIPFAVRKRLVTQGVADLKNVLLHDSGPYIISAATFPSYFLRDQDTVIRAHAEMDLNIFIRIAARLGITMRYVGEEPTSRVTSLYNETMAQLLPAHGIECRILPRFAVDDQPVSASTVRQAIHDGRLDDVASMLPQTTLAYFRSDEAKPVAAAIRSMSEVKHY